MREDFSAEASGNAPTDFRSGERLSGKRFSRDDRAREAAENLRLFAERNFKFGLRPAVFFDEDGNAVPDWNFNVFEDDAEQEGNV